MCKDRDNPFWAREKLGRINGLHQGAGKQAGQIEARNEGRATGGHSVGSSSKHLLNVSYVGNRICEVADMSVCAYAAVLSCTWVNMNASSWDDAALARQP